jgi:hypothetical protein
VNYTTEQLYEQAKRSLRQACLTLRIVAEGEPAFILACHECGLPFRKDIELGLVAEHARLEHDTDVDAGKLKLDLIFIGSGPPPSGDA